MKTLVKKADLSDREFAKNLSVSRQTLSTWYGKQRLADRVKIKVEEFFKVGPEIWTSKEMSKSDMVQEHDVTPLYTSKVKGKTLPETSIPVFNDGGTAGNAEMYADFKERPAAFIRVPGYEDCDFATYAYGHSMYPVIESGCLILCRNTEGKQMILWGEIYYIITQDYRVIKRLQKGSVAGTVLAVSENEEKRKDGDKKYEPIELKVDDIRDLYLVKGVIKKIQI